ncbi:hypothetical protein IK110_02630 [Candidatus Saccharibacteria bacterium]|nr:hypothetical protein [Candidatus Saccharibacteria bacterium]
MSANSFLVFSIGKHNFAGIKAAEITTASLSEAQALRLFSTKALAGKELSVYEIEPKETTTCARVIGGKYYSDCNKDIIDLLASNKNLFGFPSLRMNSLFKSIVKISSSNISILGENGWNSLKELFETLNKSSSYVVLRKHEKLPEGFVEDDHDLDILCDDLDEIVFLTGAQKRNIGISSYQILVDGKMIDFDIRFAGDNYIDSRWAKAILATRIINDKKIAVMNDENQLFSILYHCLTQKNSISKHYVEQIHSISDRIFGADYKITQPKLLELLAAYMKTNAYLLVKPSDSSVVQNKQNIKTLKKMLKKTSRKTELIRKLYIKTPHKIKDHLSEKKRQELYNIH